MGKLIPVIMALLSLVACDPNTGDAARQSAGATKEAVVAARGSDFATVRKGFEVYRKNCAACHGSEGQGAPNWQQAGVDGKYPPPPLNGTGHAWHHPRAALVRTIRHGTVAIGGNMPAWKGKLTDDEIAAVIAWFQSRWPDELYEAWSRMDRQSGQG